VVVSPRGVDEVWILVNVAFTLILVTCILDAKIVASPSEEVAPFPQKMEFHVSGVSRKSA
jgi:hypothetical protein